MGRILSANLIGVCLAALFFAIGCGQPRRMLDAPAAALIGHMPRSFVEVRATSWSFNHQRPWQQRPGPSRETIGCILPGGLILVTAQPVANHRSIELTRMDTKVQGQARVVVADYEANLALLKPTDPQFLDDTQSLSLAPDAATGDVLTVLQPRSRGSAIPSDHPVISIEVADFPHRSRFLVYRLHGTLSHREGHFSLPVFKGERLAGLLHKYDSDTQIMDVIAVPVIAHFLADAENGAYQGFPTAGVRYSAAKDAQLRRHLGLVDGDGGVFIEAVRPGSPGDRAGMQTGDILASIAGQAVDTQGQYQDVQYGRMDIAHLLRCRFQSGETIPLEIIRKGERRTLELPLRHTPGDAYLVPPYVVDRPPRYHILGGLVLQELTGSYLERYMKNGSRRPWNLMRYFYKQDYLKEEKRDKIVILSGVIPTTFTLGYEDLFNKVVRRINARPILRLEDVPKALKTPLGGFHQIEFEQRPYTIYLDPGELEVIHDQIRQRYGIPALSNIVRNIE